MTKRIGTLVGLLLVCAALVAGLRALRRPAPEALLGLWMAEASLRLPGDELHFYYFHKGGKGLYRYGQVGHNQTHSFDWRLDGDQLELRFRKTGERALTTFTIRDQEGVRTLELASDPRAATPTRYRYRPTDLALSGPMSLPDPEAPVAQQDAPAQANGRMWIDLRRYATGGGGFVLYQLSEHAADAGWRVGWYHRGDFDDWTTELLSYRLEPGALRLAFTLARAQALTPIELGGDRGRRTLTLSRDPRNFLARTVLVDAGPSF